MDEQNGCEAMSPAARLARLEHYFLELADVSAPNSPQTEQYMRHGGGLRLCLAEIIDMREPYPADQAVNDARDYYMSSLLSRPGLRHRANHAQQIDFAQADYIQAVVNKVEGLLESHSDQDALTVGQMPTIIEKSVFDDNTPLSMEVLAGNHLYLLLDTALKEHIRRREAIDHHRKASLVNRVIGNHALHLAVAGGAFAAALAPHVGINVITDEHVVEEIELGLKIISGTILGLDTPEVLRLQYLGRKHNKRTAELHEQLADSQELSDLALRMIYNSTRYGDSTEDGRVTDRSGTSDKADNLRRFAIMDEQFHRLYNDPGGKPYSSEQALGYAARFLVERRDQLNALIKPSVSAAEQQALFLKLTQEIMTEDLARMRKGLSSSRVRQKALNVIAIVPATLFPSALSAASDATTFSRDTSGALRPRYETISED